MNCLDIVATSPDYGYKKRMGARKENLHFDIVDKGLRLTLTALVINASASSFALGLLLSEDLHIDNKQAEKTFLQAVTHDFPKKGLFTITEALHCKWSYNGQKPFGLSLILFNYDLIWNKKTNCDLFIYTFSRAWRRVHEIASSSDWFMGLSAFVVIGQNDH